MVPFSRHSTSKNSATVKLGLGSFRVIENGLGVVSCEFLCGNYTNQLSMRVLISHALTGPTDR